MALNESDSLSPAQKPAAALEASSSGKGGNGSWSALRTKIPLTRPQIIRIGGIAAFALFLLFAVPAIWRALSTVSTDDAYINGHVTFVAPRVAGQVVRVHVDDNNRVRKGDVLVELDREPYQVKVDIAEAMVESARADLAAARAQTRGLEGKARSLRFNLENAMEGVGNEVALLRARVATLTSKRATLTRVKTDYDREAALVKANVSSKQKLDSYSEALRVAEAEVEAAEQGVYQVRVGLGLPRLPTSGDLTRVPAALDQSYSAVKKAQGQLLSVVAELGIETSLDNSPEEMIAEFLKRDPEGNIDRIYEELTRNAPPVRQASAKLAQAEQQLEEAQLNLRYCDVVAEIDGVVTRRNVNPGNNLVVGQSLMAVRSLDEIWVDANFKETQLADLRIGQAVDLEVDMYGSHQQFRGRISGFTMGTGSTLALLPAENATGNFVKVVQRLPVRIEFVDYDPGTTPLFIGLSVTPHVLLNEPPSGAHAGEVLQPYLAASKLDAAAVANTPAPAEKTP